MVRILLTVEGAINSVEFQEARYLVEELAKVHKNVKPSIVGVMPVDWPFLLESRARENKEDFLKYANENQNSQLLVYTDKIFLGGIAELKHYLKENLNFEAPDGGNWEDAAEDAMYHALKSIKNPLYCISLSGGSVDGKIVIELFEEICPKTCANFVAYCEGRDSYSYEGCPVHRIVTDGYLQTGDVVSGNGSGSISIYGETFEDENFVVKHDRSFIVGMANKGRHTNGSQFYITFRPLPSFDTNFVGFGRVVDGLDVLKAINTLETASSGRPKEEVKIVNLSKL